VNLRYASTLESNAQKLVSDLYYIENMSLLLDLWIMVKTAGVMLGGRGV
jgi:lipopolysaccharide/colanic/teichoic acid biosynthesis glycosyltransferase